MTKKSKNRQFFRNSSTEKTKAVQQNQSMQQNWSSSFQTSFVLNYLQFFSKRFFQAKIFRMITVFAIQSIISTFVSETQPVPIVQKSISITYNLNNDAFGPNSQKFDYAKSKSNVRYRSIQKSRKTIHNDWIIFTQNAKRQKNFEKNFQQKYREFYNEYNHLSATYEIQNRSKYNDYHFQSIQFRLFSEQKKNRIDSIEL